MIYGARGWVPPTIGSVGEQLKPRGNQIRFVWPAYRDHAEIYAALGRPVFTRKAAWRMLAVCAFAITALIVGALIVNGRELFEDIVGSNLELLMALDAHLIPLVVLSLLPVTISVASRAIYLFSPFRPAGTGVLSWDEHAVRIELGDHVLDAPWTMIAAIEFRPRFVVLQLEWASAVVSISTHGLAVSEVDAFRSAVDEHWVPPASLVEPTSGAGFEVLLNEKGQG